MEVSVTISTAPVGSAETTIEKPYPAEVITSTLINSLANNTESSAFSYSNKANKTYATVDVILAPISPTGTPAIQIISGSEGYEMTITTTASTARRVRFIDIPATFLSSFTVKNITGVAFSSSNNFVIVYPQY